MFSFIYLRSELSTFSFSNALPSTSLPYPVPLLSYIDNFPLLEPSSSFPLNKS